MKGALWFVVQESRSGCVGADGTGGQHAWKPAAVVFVWALVASPGM